MGRCASIVDEIQREVERYSAELSRNRETVFGWFCAYTPVEILLAAGLRPYRIVPEPGREITLADAHIERSFCPYVRACFGNALKGNYDLLSGLVFVNSCDPMRRLHDVWRYYIGGEFITLLDVPRLNSDTAVVYFRESLERFVTEIEEHYRLTISRTGIRKAINDHNNTRSLLKELYITNYNHGMPVAAAGMQRVVRAGTMLPATKFSELAGQLLDEITHHESEAYRGPRLLVSGSVMDNPLILELVEQCGGRVVGDDLCTGTRLFWQLVEPEDDPLTALSRHYLNRVPCPRMKDAQRRFDNVFRLIDDFQADGIVIYTMKFCDLFLFDIPVFKEQLGARGVPCLVLEGDYTPGTLGRVRTRIEAFIEMLEQNVATH